MNGAATVRERLERALSDRYREVHVDFGPQRAGRISGILVSPDFEGLTTDQRQDDLWDVVRVTLGAESSDVSTIVTLTPDEYEDLRP